MQLNAESDSMMTRNPIYKWEETQNRSNKTPYDGFVYAVCKAGDEVPSGAVEAGRLGEVPLYLARSTV